MSTDVLHVITDLDLGGAESTLATLLTNGLSGERRHAVLSLKDRGFFADAIEREGVPVRTLQLSSSMPGIGAVRRLQTTVHELNPRILQGWMYHGNLAASVAALLATSPRAVAWNIRQSLYDLASERPTTRQVIRASRWLSRQPRAIVYNSRVAQAQHEDFGFSSRLSTVITNGVDTGRFRPDPERARLARRELHISEHALIIGCVARADPKKNHPLLIQCFGTLAAIFPDLHLVLAGAGTDDDALRAVLKNSPSAQQRLHLIGQHSSPESLMPAFDVYCSSSLAEGFPNAVAEAMACGVPCVGTDVGDTRIIIGACGELVPSADRDALTAALQRVLSAEPAHRRALGQAARRRICANFALDRAVARYAKLYESLLGSAATG